jgi:hypothetical protein
MSKPIPFAWAWGDPALVLEKKRDLDEKIKRGQARELQNKRRRIKRLLKEQKQRMGKGQK